MGGKRKGKKMTITITKFKDSRYPLEDRNYVLIYREDAEVLWIATDVLGEIKDQDIYEFLNKFYVIDKNRKDWKHSLNLVTTNDIDVSSYWGFKSDNFLFPTPYAPCMILGLDIFKKEFLVHCTLVSEDHYETLEGMKKVIKPGTKNIDAVGPVMCRSCKEYNDYAEADGLMDDGNYTCWNCAGHYLRVKAGLIGDVDNKVMMIRKYNNIRG